MTKDNFDENKRTEIDYRINLYTIRCLKIMLISIVIMWLLNYFHIFIVNMKLVSQGFGVSCGILLIVLFIASKINLHHVWVKYFLITSTILGITVLGITLTYHTLLLSIIPLLLATQYADNWTTIYTYVLTLISTFLIVICGYFWGLCDANMLLLTTEPASAYVKMFDNGVYLGEINSNPWYTLIMYFVVPRCALLSLTLPVIQSISHNILNYEKYAVDMKKLSERDEMTGVYNRNKYLSMIENEYPKVENVAVLFCDVNNLKEVNDNEGHDKGDILITNVAQIILSLTDSNKKAYRIGGDEFVLIVENPKEGELERLLEKWHELIELKSKAASLDLSAAIGYASGKGKDIEEIVQRADEKMYDDKSKQKKLAKMHKK